MRLNEREINRVNKHNRGQAMMLIAFAFVGLVAFTGLVIDVGIVFAHIGHLRRGVDAAALSAAGQLRKGWDDIDVENAAGELILLNLPAKSTTDLNVKVYTCNEPTITIPGCSDSRKMAQVSASLGVNLAFLPIVGWHTVTINAEAISEAASVDLMLVIDTSTSMAYETQSWKDAVNDDERKDAVDACRIERGDTDGCMPFENVRTAAHNLIGEMDPDYDRVGIVTFDRFAGTVRGVLGEDSEFPETKPNLGLTDDILGAVTNKLNAIEVYPVPDFDNLCENFDDADYSGNPFSGIPGAACARIPPRG